MSKQITERITGLLEEEPISFYPNAAVTFGVNEAIVLQQISFYMNINKKKHSKRHFKQGRWWVFNTYKQWCEDHFPWLSERGLQGVILGLEKQGVLLSMQGVENTRDRRKWYSVDRKKVAELVQNAIQKRAMHDANYAPSHDAKNVSSETQNLYDENTESTSEITYREETTYARANASAAQSTPLGDPDDLLLDAEEAFSPLTEKTNSARAENATKRLAEKPTTAPHSARPPKTPAARKPTPAGLLAEALGLVIAEGDGAKFGKVASALNKAGVTCDEFGGYVVYWREQSKRTTNWPVTLHSLTGGNRMSEYITWRANHANYTRWITKVVPQVLNPVQDTPAANDDIPENPETRAAWDHYMQTFGVSK